MKKISIILLAVITLGLTIVSCTKDDVEVSIEGKWNYESAEGFIGEVSVGNIPGASIGQVNTVGCSKNSIELKTGGVLESVTYTGDKCTVAKGTGTWTKDGDNLSLLVSGTTQNFTVESVTDTTLKVKTTQTYNGIVVTAIVTFIKA